ncbi:MAG: bifunctional metallophosphatase/5'-nucleotidase [Candidatus Riflebacteria bacterium]|nr:bifunctional metallophosphatase/5'-nucleotidase [Candidatus Riflebacteria bacterium]
MQNSKKYILLTLLFIVVFGFSPAFADTKVTILHTNDTHAHLIPFDDADHGTNVGGIVRRAGLIELIKKEGNNPLLLDAGDIFQGTTFFTIFKGEACYRTAKALGIDATTMGNHELDLGIEHLLAMLDKTQLRLLACNVAWPDGKKLVFQPYSVFVRNGIKIGVIGRVGHDNWGDCNIKVTNKMKLLDDTETVREVAKRIRPYVDLLVVISHSEVENDRKLAASVAEIDIVVGGHTHSKIMKPELIKHNSQAGNYDNGLGGTLFTEAYEWGHYLGRVDFVFDDNKKIKSWDGGLIEVRPDHEAFAPRLIKDLVRYYDFRRQKLMDTVIAHSETGLPYEKSMRSKKMCPAGVFTCESLKHAVKADIGMVNAKGVRCGIAAGDIKIGDIHTMLPFDNTIIVFTMKGDQLPGLFDHAAKIWEKQSSTVFAGVTGELYVDENKAKNIRVNGQPIDPNREYTIAVTSFIADGNDGGDVFFAKPVSIKDSGIIMRDAVIEYMESLKEIPVIDYEPLKIIRTNSK